eukprot:gene32393-52712_t
MAAEERSVTLAELAAHDADDDCWIARGSARSHGGSRAPTSDDVAVSPASSAASDDVAVSPASSAASDDVAVSPASSAASDEAPPVSPSTHAADDPTDAADGSTARFSVRDRVAAAEWACGVVREVDDGVPKLPIPGCDSCAYWWAEVEHAPPGGPPSGAPSVLMGPTAAAA